MTVLAFALAAVSGRVDLAKSQAPRLARATLTVAPDGPLQTVPRSFLGVSTEYWALPLYGRRMTVFERVLGMLRVPGGGPLVLRVGGDSADRAFWDPGDGRLPGWAFTLTPKWLGLAGAVVRRLGARLIIDLNLITATPTAAAAWAQAAEQALPRHSIIGFEIGNEPDIYSHAGWAATTAGKMIAGDQLPLVLTPADYAADFRAYAAALHQVVPRVPLLGPALANPRADVRWIARLLADKPTGLGTISVHRYPYTACAKRRSQPVFPTLDRLLSRRATAGLASSLAPAIALAHRAGLPIRLTELNSVTCSGRPGVSNAFATGLWAPVALMDLIRAGINGANIHIRANTINAPFALGSTGLTARPLLYGLILFARTLGPRAALASVQLHARSSPRLSAWAVRVGGHGLHVLLVNEGRHSVRVTVRIPTAGPASLQRLLAPSAASRSQVTLDGQQIGRDATWRQRRIQPWVWATKRGYPVTVPRFSAALLDARLRPGALAGLASVR
jgi:hypothetical protein